MTISSEPRRTRQMKFARQTVRMSPIAFHYGQGVALALDATFRPLEVVYSINGKRGKQVWYTQEEFDRFAQRPGVEIISKKYANVWGPLKIPGDAPRRRAKDSWRDDAGEAEKTVESKKGQGRGPNPDPDKRTR